MSTFIAKTRAPTPWLAIGLLGAFAAAGCSRDHRAAMTASDAGSQIDAGDPRKGFPAGAIATYGWPDQGSTDGSRLVIYPAGATAKTAQLANLKPDLYCGALAFDSHGIVYVAIDPPPPATAHVEAFTLEDSGSHGPSRTIDLAAFGFANDLADIAIDSHDNLYLLRTVGRIFPSNDAVVVIALSAAKADKPLRTLAGDQTGLSGSMSIAIDERDQLVVLNRIGEVLVFAPDADGNAAPVRRIENPLISPASLAVDSAGAIYVSDVDKNSISVFASGKDTAPVRVLSGAMTALDFPTALAIDADDQLLVAPSGSNPVGPLHVFAKGASGNVKPTLGASSSSGEVAVAR
ncbi:MAG TPA: hypothetical protein VF331_03160 [Polyangiales bacterium]